jgi:hypothetical protein
MYNFILENKLTIFLIIIAIVITFYSVKEKLTDVDITEQLNQSLEQDSAGNVLIDNEILTGKIELPEVAYTDPNISDLYVNFVNEKNDESLEKYNKGSIVFDQTIPPNTECYKYNCMPGSYSQCTNNVYDNNNKVCDCKASYVCNNPKN